MYLVKEWNVSDEIVLNYNKTLFIMSSLRDLPIPQFK